MFYRGHTPGIHFYDNLDINGYKDVYREDWSFKDEAIKYLEKDLYSLYQVMIKANEQIHDDHNINIMEGLTISSLAMKIFLSKFYDNNIPLINKASIYNDIKAAYYGGITEVYKPYGENLYYYDVNSLYPYVALNSMPGLNCEKLTFYKNDTNINSLFGFFYCKITAPLNHYLGLLPIRVNKGIESPVGSWEGWYFSEELKFAQESGYKITVLKGYNFNMVSGVFSKYIEKIYKIKSTTKKGTQKAIAKSLLNNLLGRFGISLDKTVTEIMTDSTFKQKSLRNKIVSYKSNNKLLVTYVPKLDFDIIKSHNLDMLKILKSSKDKETQQKGNTSVVISAAITAYARIHMCKIKSYILSKGGNIYYSDTDSIVTNMILSDIMVDKKSLFKNVILHK